MPYFLHYAGTQFELPDSEAALKLMRQVETFKRRTDVGGRLHVPLKEAGRVVYIFVSESTPIAVSGGEEPRFTEEPPEPGPQIY
jgi:hypothetical protein